MSGSARLSPAGGLFVDIFCRKWLLVYGTDKPAHHQQLDLAQAQGSAAAAVMGGSARLSPAGGLLYMLFSLEPLTASCDHLSQTLVGLVLA
jgi:hypothetical protein